jgi:hypothetical protein
MNHLKEKNFNITKIVKEHPIEAINFEMDTDKNFNSSIFKQSNLDKPDFLNSININDENKIVIPNSESSIVEVGKVNNTMKNASVKISLNNSKSELNLFQNKLNTVLENSNSTSTKQKRRTKNLSNNMSMTHLPLIPVRKRYFYENKNMRSSNLEIERKMDIERIQEIKNNNEIALNNIKGMSKCINFNIFTPLVKPLPNNKVELTKENKIVVNSTFTSTLYNQNYKTLIVKVKIKDVSNQRSKV